ncbi:MAG: hypothetical protein QMD46_03370 [Methanomicrobiales archaeon]|nr:hypothetical protein [Methanomicrobiales archaeon]MDI6876032.1 hypothetical protein [Methanomicrobiales archaeon]
MSQADERLNQQNAELAAARKAADLERERYHDLFDTALEGYSATDRSGTIREANRAVASLLAVHKGSLRGRSLIPFVAEGCRGSSRPGWPGLRAETRAGLGSAAAASGGRERVGVREHRVGALG